MEDWMKQPVSQLKRLVKSRAGRIAELQMEIKILEGIIDRKVREGDLSGSPSKKAERPEPKEKAERREAPKEEEPAKEENAEEAPEEKGESSKISSKSSDHAFEEID